MPDTPYRAELDAALGAIARGDVVTFSPDVAARIMERAAHIDALTSAVEALPKAEAFGQEWTIMVDRAAVLRILRGES